MIPDRYGRINPSCVFEQYVFMKIVSHSLSLFDLYARAARITKTIVNIQ